MLMYLIAERLILVEMVGHGSCGLGGEYGDLSGGAGTCLRLVDAGTDDGGVGVVDDPAVGGASCGGPQGILLLGGGCWGC